MLLRGARKRNPSIVTYALSWGIPWWPGNGSYFTPDTISYHVAWLKCIRDVADTNINYLGVWNERSWGGVDYILSLRSALDAAGFGNTGIVIGDDGGNADDFVKLGRANATFAAAVAAIGIHYPCVVAGASAVEALGWKFWASEDWWCGYDWAGAGCYARTIARNWLSSRMTGTVAWSLIWSTYSNLPDQDAGLMQAQTPWSGAYTASPPLWAAAHFGQFTAVGWRLLTDGRGSGHLSRGGSYIGFVPPLDAADGGDFTLVFETTEGACKHCNDAPSVQGPQSVRVRLTGGLASDGTTLAVWASNATTQFTQQTTIVVSGGGYFNLTLPSDAIVTVTTLRNGSHGGVVSPPKSPFLLPYVDDFDGNRYAYDALGRFWGDQAGSWAVRNGSFNQVAEADPASNGWIPSGPPFTMLGPMPVPGDATATAFANVSVVVGASFGASMTRPVLGGARANGDSAVLSQCDGSDLQRWAFTPEGGSECKSIM